MPDHDRLVTKMEINNLIYSRPMKASSQEAIDNQTGYAATRYPDVANRVYSERQSITPQGAAYPLRLLSDLGNAENSPQTFPRGYFFEQRHKGLGNTFKEMFGYFQYSQDQILHIFLSVLAVIKGHCHKDFVLNFVIK